MYLVTFDFLPPFIRSREDLSWILRRSQEEPGPSENQVRRTFVARLNRGKKSGSLTALCNFWRLSSENNLVRTVFVILTAQCESTVILSWVAYGRCASVSLLVRRPLFSSFYVYRFSIDCCGLNSSLEWNFSNQLYFYFQRLKFIIIIWNKEK